MVLVNKVAKLLDKLLDTVIVIVCILLLLIGTYSMLDNLWLYQNATDRSVLRYKPATGEVLTPEKIISGNQVAWITIDDTSIDYPVMQGEDNFEFLNKDPYGNFSLSGSIFLDYRNKPDLSDPYCLVYGHHMSHGAMFGALDDFQSRAFFDAHRDGIVTTSSASYPLRIFAVSSADATDSTVFNPTGHTGTEIIAFLKENAQIYVEPEAGKRVLALSTCSGDTSIKRLIVFATIQD